MNMFWTCFAHMSIIYKIRSQLSSLVFPNKYMLPIWNFQKLTIFFRTAKLTLAKSLKFPWHGFYKAPTLRKEQGRQAKMEGICMERQAKMEVACEEITSNNNKEHIK